MLLKVGGCGLRAAGWMLHLACQASFLEVARLGPGAAAAERGVFMGKWKARGGGRARRSGRGQKADPRGGA
jgi:hypothetical protein